MAMDGGVITILQRLLVALNCTLQNSESGKSVSHVFYLEFDSEQEKAWPCAKNIE